MNNQEEQIRLTAFEWLSKETAYDEVLSWHTLKQGFDFQGQRVTLVGQQGIWKPKQCKIPLSITTSPNGQYNDSLTRDGYLAYKYRGTNPNHRDNVGLREAMLEKVPLIYFHGISTAKYLAAWPVYIEQADPAALEFHVAVDDKNLIGRVMQDHVSEDSDFYRRQYITSTTKTRLHQQSFRERVLAAYQRQCSFCQLKHAELLDAAHITPDSDEHGEPLVSNGLSLCKIHHAAFDRHLIGVDPDYRIVVRDDLLREIDGPMLKHGIQELHSKSLVLPSNRKQWPDRARLDVRYRAFRNAM